MYWCVSRLTILTVSQFDTGGIMDIAMAQSMARDYRMATLVAWNASGELQDIMQAGMTFLWPIYAGACRWHRQGHIRHPKDHVGAGWAQVALVSADGTRVWQADFAGDALLKARIIAG